jgi:hypothetical protein
MKFENIIKKNGNTFQLSEGVVQIDFYHNTYSQKVKSEYCDKILNAVLKSTPIILSLLIALCSLIFNYKTDTILTNKVTQLEKKIIEFKVEKDQLAKPLKPHDKKIKKSN